MKRIAAVWLVACGLLWAGPCEEKSFSLSAFADSGNGLTLMDIVRDMSQQCQISVVFEDDRSRGRLSQHIDLVSIRDYSLLELFDFLFDAHNLYYDYDSKRSIVRVSYYDTANIDVDYVNVGELKTESVKSITVGARPTNNTNDTMTTGSGSNSDYTTVSSISQFTFWTNLKTHLEEILQIDEDYDAEVNKIVVDQDAAIITVTATKRQMRKIRQYLKRIEANMHAQVMLESYLIELTYTDEKSSGVDWRELKLSLNPVAEYSSGLIRDIAGTPLVKNSQTNYSYVFDAAISPTGVINFLDTYGDVEVLSNPKILTLNNQPAVINVGNQLSYRYQSGTVSYSDASPSITYELGSVFVGLTLNIIPEITEDDHIIMRVNPVTSEERQDGNAGTDADGNRIMPPDIRIKQMSSIVKVKDGQRVMIGGLIEKTNNNDSSKVPVLGDVPLFGKLFSYEGTSVTKKELFILIVPTLIKNNKFPSLDDAVLGRFE
jgi:general secretion pathway protein D